MKIDSSYLVRYTDRMKKKTNLSTQDYVLIGVFAAILAALSQVAIPMPSGIPVTLQTFAIALCGFMLGTRKGTITVLVYLAMGAIGLPVFANFRGGLHMFTGPTGGFLFGFLPLVALCGGANLLLAAMGLLVCHFFGVLQYSLIAGVSFIGSLLNISVPYLFKDTIVIVAAYAVERMIHSRLQAVQKRF